MCALISWMWALIQEGCLFGVGWHNPRRRNPSEIKSQQMGMTKSQSDKVPVRWNPSQTKSQSDEIPVRQNPSNNEYPWKTESQLGKIPVWNFFKRDKIPGRLNPSTKKSKWGQNPSETSNLKRKILMKHVFHLLMKLVFHYEILIKFLLSELWS